MDDADTCWVNSRFEYIWFKASNDTWQSTGHVNNSVREIRATSVVQVCLKHREYPVCSWKNTVIPTGCRRAHSLWKRFPGSLHPRCPCLRHKCQSPGNNLCLWRTSRLPLWESCRWKGTIERERLVSLILTACFLKGHTGPADHQRFRFRSSHPVIHNFPVFIFPVFLASNLSPIHTLSPSQRCFLLGRLKPFS